MLPWRSCGSGRSPNWLLLFVPVSVLLEHSGASPALVFFAAALAIVPAARLIVQGTEHIAARTGSAVGGLLNATFGNLPELIIATVALRSGLLEMVRASIIGAILANLLMSLGVALLIGGVRYHNQEFNPRAARVYSSMMLLAVISLAGPGAFERVFTAAEHLPQVHAINVRLAVMLMVVYALTSISCWAPTPTSSPVRRPSTATVRGPAGADPGAGHAHRGVGAGGLDERDPGRRRRGHRRGAGDVADLHRHDHRRDRRRSRGEPLGHRRRGQEQAGPDDGGGLRQLHPDRAVRGTGAGAGEPADRARAARPLVQPDRLGVLLLAVLIGGSVGNDGKGNWFKGVQLLTVYATIALLLYFVPA